MFLSLPNVDCAIDRVAMRAMLGGHAIDEATIRRRFSAGLRNFFQLYMPAVSSWTMFDNSIPGKPAEIAQGCGGEIQAAKARFEKLKVLGQ
jgi:predicted ABC-type ATPase